MQYNFFQKDIFLVNLNPILGSEQSGIRPCVIVSGNAFHVSGVVFVVPITSKIKRFQSNIILVPDSVNNLDALSEILIGQIRTVSSQRLIKKIGEVTDSQLEHVLQGFDMLCDR